VSELVIGVVGAHGSLGRLISASLESDGARAVAVDLRRSERSERASLLGTLDALVFGAPVVDAGLHREALESGCHIVDVAVDRGLNHQLLALDQPARGARRSVVAMAGFAPGLTGVLAAHMLQRFTPRVARLIVAVLQSPTGTAGHHGTREMLDLLTGADVTYRNRQLQTAAGTIAKVRLFDLRIAEPEIAGFGTELELATGFGQASMHAQVRALRAVRSRIRAAYPPVRDRAARRKAQTPGTSEQTRLSAVALDGSGQPVGGRLLTVSSDYGATAAVAAATATAAARGRLAPGASHLRQFLTLDGLLALPPIEAVIDADTGPLTAPKQSSPSPEPRCRQCFRRRMT